MHLRLDQLVGTMFPDADKVKIMEIFREHYDSSGYRNTHPYPGVPGTLESMHRNGCRMFVATNKRGVAANILLRRFDPEAHIERLLASDCVVPPLGKSEIVNRLIVEYHLDRDQTALVGDTAGDLDAALDNDVSFIFASYGYGKLDQNESNLCMRVISAFPELMGFCDKQL